MNKFLLAITLLFAVFAFGTAEAQLNTTSIKNATDSGLHALNKTADLIDDKADQLKDEIRDFFDITDDSTAEKVGKYAIVVAIAAAGVFVGTHGYKLTKPVSFISGFGLGGVFFSAVFATLFPVSKAAPIAAFLVGGLILGLVAVYFYRVGIFILGGAGGLAIGAQVAQLAQAGHVLTIVLLIVFAIIGGILVLYLEKPANIISTSVFGSWMFVRSVGFFAGSYSNGSNFDTLTQAQKNAFFAYFGGLVVLAIIFSIVQFKYTAVGINYGLGKDDEKDAKKAENAAATAGAAKPNAQKPVNMV
ncbi:hypothetical protein DYB37_002699 [Aphanomyces astaci]|uniref:Transmembrane protein 198 n=1 Tax=Aphanomyces astaci TaxID=112090 RepID=A0A396ZUY3_APHAT|nr:hypothetical protein DYB36_009194 [Aphanomyces astaci]RHY20110.1 hypothetical protein DYB25_003025 [Aphanomyces astaci]RHY43863.1 hypothetical protein DYB38_003608 [Aphanomyces astaci]RHY63715.1 hypothetical protein DYB30_000112 [Aphanomyces astaci]RHY72914.1 hypothetical protein DYB34_005062 [Aphanomyces astaci]